MVFVKAQKHLQHATGNIDELLNRRYFSYRANSSHIEVSEGEPMLDLLQFQEDGGRIWRLVTWRKMRLFEGFYPGSNQPIWDRRVGKNYLAFTFQDDSGEIEGSFGMPNLIMSKPLQQEKLSTCKGRREVYNNTPQVNQITRAYLSLANPMTQRGCSLNLQ